jgi:regulator of replication initiation timing
VEGNGAVEGLLEERRALIERLEREREQLERLRSIASNLTESLAHGEAMLDEIDSVLGRNPQLRLEEADVRLRGRRLEEVAVEVLSSERGAEAEVHYREWYELLRGQGHLVAGKEPMNTFLSQINRSASVERVGRRTGRYRLRAA